MVTKLIIRLNKKPMGSGIHLPVCLFVKHVHFFNTIYQRDKEYYSVFSDDIIDVY